MRAALGEIPSLAAASALDEAAGSEAILECRGIRKLFPGILALDGVDLQLRRGEIHAFVGQNGAGKSTLVKILTGVYAPTEGEIFVEGAPVRMASPADAERAGIAIVHQDQPLVGQFDIARNIFLGQEIIKNGLLDFPAMRKETTHLLKRVGAEFSPTALIRDLTVAQRALVAIAAALMRNPRVLILDEPTASLSDAEAEQLFGIVRGLRDQGVSIIYISHYLDEVFDLVDRITVLRDGRLVSTLAVANTSRQDIIDAMIGRSLNQLYPKEAVAIGEPVLEISGLSQGRAVHDVSLNVRKGEILGLAGLVGAGRTELAMAIIGALDRDGGEIKLAGTKIAPRSPQQAKLHGFALVPEDRRNEGLITDLSMRENLSLPSIEKFSRIGLLRLGQERDWVKQVIDRLGILPPNPRQLARNLSGGNQQKVVIGRWLAGDSKVFIFDEPTTGVDVGSKVEIYRQMMELARRGAAVIFISSDFEELAGMCDRVVVMRKGRVVATRAASEIDAGKLMLLATGGEGKERAEAGDNEVPRKRSRTLGAALTRYGTIAGMLLVMVAIGIITPDFLAVTNLLDVVKQGSLLAFVALGMTVMLVVGGLDMSAGAVNQLTSNLAAGTIMAGLGTASAILLGGAAGLGIGLFNAFLIIVFRIPPFVATLGTMFVAMGMSLLYNGGQALTPYDQPGFFFIGQGAIGPLPVIVLVLLGVLAILHLIFKHTRAGLRMYAVGENLPAAELRGISRIKAIVTGFVIGGFVIGISGVVLASYSYGASALASGFDFLVSALAAAFLGSSLSRTGELDVIGTVVAALFLAGLANGLVLMGVSNQALPGIQGAVLILSVLLGVIHRRGIGQVLIF
jgi:ABC-type sugar transport system ATPase subunit/ribose/xylose/arabinose/galactoside ABC-type transport system permease subunit